LAKKLSFVSGLLGWAAATIGAVIGSLQNIPDWVRVALWIIAFLLFIRLIADIVAFVLNLAAERGI